MSDKPNSQPDNPRTYLGDGAYAEYDGYQFWIFTHDGYRETNRICLEPHVLRTFQAFIKEISDGKSK